MPCYVIQERVVSHSSEIVTIAMCTLQVQQSLGCKRAIAFDLTAACSGFVLGLVTASRFIKGE